MHPVWAARGGGAVHWHGAVARGAFYHDTGVTLECVVAHVVIRVRARKFRVRRTVAGGALQSTMPCGKAIQRKARCRGVGRGGKSRVHGYARRTICFKDGGVANLTVVVSGSPAVALLASRLHEPAHSVRRADGTHGAVAALTLHFHGPIRSNRPTHRAAQTFGG